MIKLLRKERGATLITVIIITAVLTILTVVLLDSALQGLVTAKRHRNVDLTYYSGQSAIEKWFNQLQQEAENDVIGTEYDSTVNGTNFKDYVEYLIDKVEPKLDTEYIDIAAKSSSVAGLSGNDYSEISVKSIDVIGEPVLFNQGKNVRVTIGIQAIASFSDPSSPYSAANQPIFAQKDFVFTVPKNDFELAFAILTLGDLYTSTRHYESNGTLGIEIPGFNADIKGDVSAFGTFPKNILWPEQFYYGGIMAMHGMRLNIKGNAYSRSFIRTGPYRGISESVSYSDNSRIDIYRDAVAQSIQAFGNNNEIAVFRNAYTFDDIEMNGENSIIAINGSAIGLSHTFANRNHDALSAIVNSAPIHNMISTNSLKSRIVVNGDVIIPGGTFKIDTVTGEYIGNIEDASIVWYDDGTGNGIAYYKLYPWGPDDLARPELYHENLRDKLYSLSSGEFLGGPLNIFQVWSSIDWTANANRYDIGTGGGISGGIDSLLNSIRLSRNSANFPSTPPASVSGCWSYELAANRSLYSNEIPGYSSDGFQEIRYVNRDSYVIDNIYSKDADGNITGLKFDKNVWDGVSGALYTTKVFGKLDDLGPTDSIPYEETIKYNLENYTQLLAKRDYPPTGTSGSEWSAWAGDAANEGVFSKLMDKLEDKVSNYSGNLYCINVPAGTSAGEHNISEWRPEVYDWSKRSRENNPTNNPADPLFDFDADNEYFLVFNEYADVDLVVSGKFNGIIFTAGAVILNEGADIRGAIISAGGGTYSGSKFIPELNKLDRDYDLTHGYEQAIKLDRGSYAGVKITPSISYDPTNPEHTSPKVDFYLGLINEQYVKDLARPYDSNAADYLNKAARINLLKKLAGQGMNLFDIF